MIFVTKEEHSTPSTVNLSDDTEAEPGETGFATNRCLSHIP